TLIASNDPQARHRQPTGAVPTAVVDPLATAVVLPDTATLPKATDTVDTSNSAAVDAASVGTASVASAGDVSVIDVIPLDDATLPATAFALSADELATRQAIVDKEEACAASYGFAATGVAGSFGGLVVAPADPSPTNQLVLEKVQTACGNPSADEPGERYLDINADMIQSAQACLAANGVTHMRTGNDESGLRSLTILGAGAEPFAAACRAEAVRTALAPFVAPVAQLYLTSPPVSRSWLSSAGGTRIVLTLIVVLVFTLLAAALGARRLLRPIRSLTRAAQRMAAGETQTRVQVRGNDEIARLGDAFNSMAETLSSNERQRQHLISDIAHELRNPLANVRGYLEGTQDDLVRLDDELVESLLDETLQLQHLIEDLQDLAVADAGQLRIHPEPTDVCDLITRTVAAHRSAADHAGIAMSCSVGDPVTLSIDPVRIKQAVSNLISNAIRYTPSGGTINVSVRTIPARRQLVIEVADTGTGISRDDLPHLFDRFFRADSSRSRATGGSGLGLAVTRHLVEAHDGTIDVRSALGRGSQFAIVLPLAATGVPPAAPAPAAAPAPSPVPASVPAVTQR
ncbi:MAG TPA: ATP-binding protein, partial [Ilumatobacteraceae bacterium]